MEWKILDTGTASAEENMRLDWRLLESLQYTDQPVIHLYDWKEPSATYGYFTNPADHLSIPEAEKQGLVLAKRPTGGGIIFHTCDLAFSVLVPAGHPGFSVNTLENYAYINRRVAAAIEMYLGWTENTTLFNVEEKGERPTFCMVKPTVYDIVIKGKKVGGAAQRRSKNGYLHQGSICMTLPNLQSLEALVSPETAREIRNNSYPILAQSSTPGDLILTRRRLKRLLVESLIKPRNVS